MLAFETWLIERTRAGAGDVASANRAALAGTWLAIARIHATYGTREDLLRACDAALAHGTAPKDVLEIVSDAALARELAARHPEADWDLRSRAKILRLSPTASASEIVELLHACRERDRLEPNVSRSEGEPNASGLLWRLAKVDPAGAVAEGSFLNHYARALAASGDAAGAASVCARLAERRLLNGETWVTFARSDAAKALPSIEAARERVPQDAYLPWAAAEAYAVLGRRAEAQAALDLVLAGESYPPSSALVALVRLDPAAGDRRLQEEARESEEAYRCVSLGDAYRALGRPAEAKAAYAKALASDPDDPVIRTRWLGIR